MASHRQTPEAEGGREVSVTDGEEPGGGQRGRWFAREKGPTLSNPMDCGLPGSSIHGIFQARVLEWGAIAFS